MVEIANKIESIRNMKNDLHSIKLMSQENADKMLQHLADFRNRICNEMSQIEHNYQSGRNHKRNTKIKSDLLLNSVSGYNESEDSKQMNEMLMKWENYSLMGTDVSDSLTSTHNESIGSQTIGECSSSVNTIDSISTPHEVTILFSKQLPYTSSNSLPTDKEAKMLISSSPIDPVDNQSKNEIFQNENISMTPDEVDKLTKKLKEIQTQNEELRNVNENIKNLLLKLSDLKYADVADAETVNKLDAVRTEAEMSSDESYRITEVLPETTMKTETEFTRSVEITNTNRDNTPTKIKVAKLIIRRFRSCEQERKYKVRVRQAEQSITLKAHHNKPQ